MNEGTGEEEVDDEVDYDTEASVPARTCFSGSPVAQQPGRPGLQVPGGTVQGGATAQLPGRGAIQGNGIVVQQGQGNGIVVQQGKGNRIVVQQGSRSVVPPLGLGMFPPLFNIGDFPGFQGMVSGRGRLGS
ncbi:hypothetical protein ABZ471_39425 [Streptomyces sp. NPDC005728]|uniref:hypothetical protein n=1 Tax=Streptomyces sp. NPDC005728 TaxID=3157054 RepID=UPI0033D80D48